MQIQKKQGKQFLFPRDYCKAIWALIYLFWVHTTLVPKLMVWYIIVSDKKLFVSHDYCDEDMSRCFNHFLLLMFIQHFQRPI